MKAGAKLTSSTHQESATTELISRKKSSMMNTYQSTCIWIVITSSLICWCHMSLLNLNQKRSNQAVIAANRREATTIKRKKWRKKKKSKYSNHKCMSAEEWFLLVITNSSSLLLVSNILLRTRRASKSKRNKNKTSKVISIQINNKKTWKR